MQPRFFNGLFLSGRPQNTKLGPNATPLSHVPAVYVPLCMQRKGSNEGHCVSLYDHSQLSHYILHIQTSILILLLYSKFNDHCVLGHEQLLSNLMFKCRNACRSPFCGPMYLFSLCRLPLIPRTLTVLRHSELKITGVIRLRLVYSIFATETEA